MTERWLIVGFRDCALFLSSSFSFQGDATPGCTAEIEERKLITL